MSLRLSHGFCSYPSRRGRNNNNTSSPRPRTLIRSSTSRPSRTQTIMEKISSGGESGGAGGSYSYDGLKRLDTLWSNICETRPDTQKAPEVVTRILGSSQHSDLDTDATCMFDVLVCGGTLGIFIATALVFKGLRVGVVERNLIKGREQEWNISRKELMELVNVGILSEADIEVITASKFNPNRCGFETKGDIWVEDILNLGVSPAKLIEIMKRRFVSLGGVVFESKSLSSISIYDDAAILKMADGDVLSSRLVVDSMGNFSPVVKQIRRGRKPDGVCLVVGSCARGFSENKTSDVIFSSSSTKKLGNTQLQYFWEAFPAGSGPKDRTTYMFTYVSAQEGGPKLEELLEDYWDLLPNYQGVALDKLEILRVIFGIFPTYSDSPLPSAFDRIIQVGDASGIQSPVSFGGFGSMTRHLGRLSNGIYEALAENFLDSYSLGLLNPYMPNLRASWMFQRAMSANPRTGVPPTFINELLYFNFQAMQTLGDSVLRPFLQDVIQFGPLVKTLGSVMLTQPQILPSIFKQVGIGVILDWFVHFLMLGYYTFLSSYIDPVIRPLIKFFPGKKRYEVKRYLEAWMYGSGLDYDSVLELNYSVKGKEVYVQDKDIDFIFVPSMVWRQELHQLSSIWTGLKLQLPRFKDHYLKLQILCATMNILFFFSRQGSLQQLLDGQDASDLQSDKIHLSMKQNSNSKYSSNSCSCQSCKHICSLFPFFLFYHSSYFTCCTKYDLVAPESIQNKI